MPFLKMWDYESGHLPRIPAEGLCALMRQGVARCWGLCGWELVRGELSRYKLLLGNFLLKIPSEPATLLYFQHCTSSVLRIGIRHCRS